MDILAFLREDIAAASLVETPWIIVGIGIDLVPTAATLLASVLIYSNETTVNPIIQGSDVARLIAAGIVSQHKTQI
jgi:hypothetical protein